jgi:hypothetical protein
VPELRRRHPADRIQTVLPVRNHPWPSHCWQPPVASDILSASRGRSGKSSRTSANRSSHHRCRPLVARPPTGASSCRSMTIATSFKPRPTNCPRLTSIGSERCRTRPTHVGKLRTGTRSAHTRETRHRSGCGALRETRSNPPRTPGPLLPRLTSRSSAGRPLRKCH